MYVDQRLRPPRFRCFAHTFPPASWRPDSLPGKGRASTWRVELRGSAVEDRVGDPA